MDSKILIVDDSKNNQFLLTSTLKSFGYNNVLEVSSALQAFEILEINNEESDGFGVDLILMDINMPELDGIEATKRIKNHLAFKRVPIVMVTAMEDDETLISAFEAGAMDYIVKPFDKYALMVRVKSALRLKHEMDERNAREKELVKIKEKLEEVNWQLKKIVYIDTLTGLPNRRHFNDVYDKTWKRGIREKKSVSLILCTVDYFRAYNDKYGMKTADETLVTLASTLNKVAQRPGDLIARYSGIEFSFILWDAKPQDALNIAETARKRVENQKMPHELSKVSDYLTLSLGVASTIPNADLNPYLLIKTAGKSLFEARAGGRNRSVLIDKI